MSRVLAKQIRERLTELTLTYAQQLVAIGSGYEQIAPNDLSQIAQRDLELIAQALETEDQAPFLTCIRERVTERFATGFDIATITHALEAIEDTLLPVIKDVEDVRFFWHTMRQARAVVTELAVQRLHESEVQYRALTDRLPMGVFVYQQDGLLSYAGNRTAELLGYDSPQEMVGHSIMDFVAPAERSRAAEIARRRISGESAPEEYQLGLLRKDGTEIDTLMFATQVPYHGQTAIQGTFIDITERKQAEEALQESEEKFRSVVENSHAGIFMVNQAYQFIYANDRVCQILGYSREDLLGLDFRAVLDDESKQLVADRYVRRQRGEDVPPRYELGVVRQDGEKKQLEMSAVVIQDPAGNVRTVGQVLDITERKQAEKTLRESERRYRQIIEDASDVVYTIDPQGYFTYINPPGLKLSGYEEDEFIGMHFTDLIPQEWKKRVLSFYINQLEEGIRETILEFPFVTRAGEERWAEQKVTLITKGDQPTGFQCILRDITERKRLEQQIQESLEHRERQVRTSTEIAQEIAAAPALDELFERVVELIKERFGYYHAQIFRYEPALNAVVLVTGYGETGEQMLAAGHRLQMGRGVVGTAAATGRSVLASDVTQDPDWVPNPFLPETKGELAVPIVLRRKSHERRPRREQILGILDVQSEAAGALSEDDQLLLEGLCGQIAIAIESTQLRQELEKQLQQLENLYRATTREGWQTTQLSMPAYVFDSQAGLTAVPDLWMPPLKEALESETLVQEDEVVALPLQLRGETIGTVGVYDDLQAPLTSEELSLLQSIAEQAGQALESARLYEEASTSAEELAILNDMGRALATTLDREAAIESIYQHTSRLMDTTNFYVALYHPETESVSFPFAIEEGSRIQWGQRQLGKGLTEHVIRTCEPLLIQEDVIQWLAQVGIEAIGQVTQAWLGVPMVIGKRVIGVIAVQSYTPRLYNEHHRDLLNAIASQAAIAIENARLFEQTQQQLVDLTAIQTTTSALTAALTFDEAIDALLPQVADAVRADRVSMFLIHEAYMTRVGTFPSEDKTLIGEINNLDDYPLTKKVVETRQAMAFAADDPQLQEHARQAFKASGVTASATVPLVGREGVLGTLSISLHQPDRTFTESEVGLLQTLADQAAQALERTRLFDEARTRAEEQAVLAEMGRALTTIRDAEAIIESIHQHTARLMDATNFYVALYHWEQDEVSFPLYVEGERIRRIKERRRAGNGLTEHIIRTREPAFIPENVSQWQNDQGIEAIGRASQSWLGVPMMIGEHVIGVIAVQSYTTPRLYDEHHRDLLNAVASQAAIAIENARLFEAELQRRHEAETLSQIAQDLSALRNLDTLLHQITERAMQLLGGDAAGLYVHQPERGVLELVVAMGEDVTPIGTPLGLGEGLAGKIWETGEPLTINDYGNWESQAEKWSAREAAVLGVPIQWGVEFLGALNIRAAGTRGAFTPQDTTLLSQFATQAAVAIDNARLFEETRKSAEELTVLNELSQALSATLNVDQVLEETYKGVSRLMDTTNFYIGLYDWEKNEVTFPINVSESQIDREITTMAADEGITGHIIQNRTSVLIQESANKWLKQAGLEQVGQDAASWLGVPLMIGNQVLGVMAIQDHAVSYRYDEHDRDMLMAIGGQTAIAIQNAHLYEGARRGAEELAIINEMGRTLTANLDVEAVVGEIYRGVSRLLDASNSYIALYDADRDEVTLALSAHEGQVEKPFATRPAGRGGLTEYLIESQRPLLIKGQVADKMRELGLEKILVLTEQDAASWLGVPITFGDQVMGTLVVMNHTTPGAYDEHDQELLTAVASQAAIAIQNARTFEQTQTRARQEQLIREINAKVSRSMNLETVLKTTARELSQALGASHAVIRLGAGSESDESRDNGDTPDELV